MYSKAAILAIAIAAANAQIQGVESDWSKLIAAVNSADAGLKSWDGTLAGALVLLPMIENIGKDLDTINSAVGSLSIPVSESDGQSLLGVILPDVGSVESLLKDTGAIASKASAVEAAKIVSSLVSSLQPQFLTLIGGIYSHVPCDLASSAISIAQPIISSYYQLDSTYGIPTVAAPATPSACAASSVAASSKVSSAAPSSAASSPVATSSATSSKPASSVVHTTSTVVPTTSAVVLPPSNTTSQNFTSRAPSTKPISGAANIVVPGGLAIVLGAVAMLF